MNLNQCIKDLIIILLIENSIIKYFVHTWEGLKKSIKERRNLASNGFLNITIVIGNKGEILESPVIYFKGLPIIENEKFRDNLKDTVENIIKTFSLKNVKQDENLIETLKIGCRKLTKEKTGKKPVTNINLVRI